MRGDGGDDVDRPPFPPAGGVPFVAILPVMYQDLRRMAAAHFAGESVGHTLQPTAVVHEVYLRMSEQDRAKITSREQFMALAAEAMRRVLIDHARRKLAAKRGGGWTRVTLSEDCGVSDDGAVDVLALEMALEKLERIDREAARVLSLRFFAGLSDEEIGVDMGRSGRWVRTQWEYARTWLRRELGAEPRS